MAKEKVAVFLTGEHPPGNQDVSRFRILADIREAIGAKRIAPEEEISND
jgi:hypothetical protein